MLPHDYVSTSHTAGDMYISIRLQPVTLHVAVPGLWRTDRTEQRMQPRCLEWSAYSPSAQVKVCDGCASRPALGVPP